LNKIKLAFDAQYKIAIYLLTSTYLMRPWPWPPLPWPQAASGALALALQMLVSNPSLVFSMASDLIDRPIGRMDDVFVMVFWERYSYVLLSTQFQWQTSELFVALG